MLTHSAKKSTRDAMRGELRRARRVLTPAERLAASQHACHHLLAHPWYRKARHIAVYTAVGSEADPGLIAATALREGKNVYLPCIPYRQGRILFVRTGYDTAMHLRRHGIPQPGPRQCRERIRTRCLDLVVLPLLGFDHSGHRLGSGAGYYDRSFSFRRFSEHNKPLLVGLAFACQQIDTLDTAEWDVPLDAIVTEQGWLEPGKRAAR